ncbi:TPA: hypothetical protein VDT61_006027 [Pseudomonas aeruginosa]|nr:hypothetical protein [Pseudomonas aeruginosa]HEP8167125.1 hypothetical protein [Pseudomonas aeruginosa]
MCSPAGAILTALRVGMAAGRVFRRGDHRHRVVIGKDTRLSGYMLEPALTAGFTSMGMDVFPFDPSIRMRLMLDYYYYRSPHE